MSDEQSHTATTTRLATGAEYAEPRREAVEVGAAGGEPPAVPRGSGRQADVVPTAPDVPYGVRLAAAWSWRVLLIGIVIYLLGKGFVLFQELIVPVLISLLVVALVRPVMQLMARREGRRGLPDSLAALLTVLATTPVLDKHHNCSWRRAR